MRTDGTELRRLTDDVARDRSAVFTPDGDRVVFHSNRDGHYLIYSIRLDGSARTQLTDISLGNTAHPSLQPGGDKLIAYVEYGGQIMAEPPWPATRDSATPVGPLSLSTGEFSTSFKAWVWSPNGQMVVGEVDDAETGRNGGIVLLDVTSGKSRWLTSEKGDSDFCWLPDNRRILFFSHSDGLVIFDVDTLERRAIPVDLPHPLAEKSFAVAPDGTAIYYGAERIESNVWMVQRDRQEQ